MRVFGVIGVLLRYLSLSVIDVVDEDAAYHKHYRKRQRRFRVTKRMLVVSTHFSERFAPGQKVAMQVQMWYPINTNSNLQNGISCLRRSGACVSFCRCASGRGALVVMGRADRNP